MTHACPPIEPGEPQRVALYATRLAYLTATCRVSLLCNLGLLFVIAAVLWWTHSVYQFSLRRQPLVVGYDPASGATHLLNPEVLTFHPTDETLRSYLMRFVREHCQRTQNAGQDYGHSLLYMDRKLTGAGIEQDIQQIQQWAAKDTDEVRVKVLNVTIEDTKNGCRDGSPPHPCRAKIDYEKAYYDRRSDRRTDTKAYAADITFILKSEITNDMIEDNPLGLIITDFHEFQGF